MMSKRTLRDYILAANTVATLSMACALIWLSFAAQAQPVDTTQPATIASQAAQANAINWNTIILAFFGMITSLAGTLGAIYLVKIKGGQDTIKTGQDVLTKVTNDTHTLVNSNMGVQLKLNAAITQRMAGLTNQPDDIAAATLAKIAYEEHLKKQATVDAGGGAKG
jgi:hypothetical protein